MTYHYSFFCDKSSNLSWMTPVNWLLSRSSSFNELSSKISSGICPVSSLRSLYKIRKEDKWGRKDNIIEDLTWGRLTGQVLPGIQRFWSQQGYFLWVFLFHSRLYFHQKWSLCISIVQIEKIIQTVGEQEGQQQDMKPPTNAYSRLTSRRDTNETNSISCLGAGWKGPPTSDI